MKESERIIYLKKLVASLRKQLAEAEAKVDRYHVAWMDAAGKLAVLEAEARARYEL